METTENKSINKKLGKNIVLVGFILTGLSLLVMLFSTTPTEVGPTGVTVFFLLLYLFSLTSLELFYRTVLSRRKHWPYWLKAIYAMAPVAFVALSSLRQLTTVDIIMGVILLIAITVYHNRNS